MNLPLSPPRTAPPGLSGDVPGALPGLDAQAPGCPAGSATTGPSRSRARIAFGWVAGAYLSLIFGLPVAALVAGFRLGAALGPWGWVPAALLAPWIGVVVFVLVAGGLSWRHHEAVRPGRLRRDLADPVYRARRLYGLCWTSVYYATPLYHLILSVPCLRRLTFRLFGYQGQMDFTVYADTWIRDLPLLDFGPGAYISNKATLGTNVALSSGMLLVDHVRVGARALVGHLAMVSTGVVLEEGAEVGVGCAVGSKVILRERASLGACCAIGHLAEVGVGAHVGYRSSLGLASKVGAGVRLAPGTLVPNRSEIVDQGAGNGLLSAQLGHLATLSRRLAPEAPLPEQFRDAALEASQAPGAARWNRFE